MERPRFLRPLALATALILAVSAVPAHAAAGRDSTRTRGVADTVTVLAPVVVKGVRSESPERASSTTVRLDRSRVARFAPTTVGDALVAIPGLQISRTGPWATQVSMRGLSGERVAVMVDGVRLETGRGHGAQTSLVPVDRVEGIEVQPGAGSAVNGSDAMAGTLEFTTHRSLFSDHRRAALTLNGRTATPGGEQAEFARLRWLSPHFGAEFSGDVSSLAHLVAAPDSTIAHSGFRDQDVTGRVEALVGSATIDYEHSAHRAYDIQLPALQTATGTTAWFPEQKRDADRLELAMPRAGLRPGLRVLGVAQSFYTGYDEYIVQANKAGLVPHATDSHTTYASRIPMTSRSVQPVVDLGVVRVLGEYRREDTSGPVSVDSLVLRYPTGVQTSHKTHAGEAVPDAWRSVWAIGATGGVTRWGTRVDGGLRFDHMYTQNDSSRWSIASARRLVDERLSGEAGVSHAFFGVTPYAHVANNFRAPNIDERFAHMMIHGGLYVMGNPDLKPEHSITGELGVRAPDLLRGHVGGVRVSAYTTSATDLITIKYTEMVFGIPRFQYQNIHSARLEGLEAQVDARVAGWQLGVGAAFPRGRDEKTGDPIPDLGASSVLLDLRVPVPHFVPQGTFNLRARWSDAHLTGAGEDLLARPAFWTGSAEAALTAMGLRWSLAVTNLTNTAYYEPLSFIPSAGRTTTLSVRRELSLPWLAFAREH